MEAKHALLPFQIGRGVSGVLPIAYKCANPCVLTTQIRVAVDTTSEKGPILKLSSASWKELRIQCVSSQRQHSHHRRQITGCLGFPLVCNFWGGYGDWNQGTDFEPSPLQHSSFL